LASPSAIERGLTWVEEKELPMGAVRAKRKDDLKGEEKECVKDET
jgi:hypothetical protein